MKIILQKVKKIDCKAIYNIRNEKSTRLESKNNNKIKFKNHKVWFSKNYNLKKNLFFICKINKQSIGYIKYTKENFYFIVSLAIKKKFRNKGLSSLLINKSEEYLPKSVLVISEVKNSNKASIGMFIKNSYTKILKNSRFSKFAKIIPKDNFNNKKQIIEKIKLARSKNNINWMKILELAFKNSTNEATSIFNNINNMDKKILILSTKLGKK